MLVLARRLNERIRAKVGEVEIWVTVVSIEKGKVRLGFDAPQEVKIDRDDWLAKEAPRDGECVG